LNLKLRVRRRLNLKLRVRRRLNPNLELSLLPRELESESGDFVTPKNDED
jgi:hypothetical protein